MHLHDPTSPTRASHDATPDVATTPWGQRDPRWQGIHADTIEVVGTSIALLRARPARLDPDADPILLVHGLGGAATNWLDVMVGLADQAGAEVVAVDLPGFGQSQPPTPRAAHLRSQVAFLDRLLTTLGWDVAEVHGNSMGGLLAATLAGTRPDRVARVVLVSPALPPPVPSDPRELAALDRLVVGRFAPFLLSWRLGRFGIQRLYAQATPEQVYAGTEALVMGSAPMRPALRTVGIEQAAASMQQAWRVDALARATHDLLATYVTDRTWVHDALAAITAPVLVVWGTADRLVGQAVVDDLQCRRPSVTRVDLEGVGHVAMIEAADHYLDLVETWRGDTHHGLAATT